MERLVETDLTNAPLSIQRIASAPGGEGDYRVIAWLSQLPPTGMGDVAFVPPAMIP